MIDKIMAFVQQILEYFKEGKAADIIAMIRDFLNI